MGTKGSELSHPLSGPVLAKSLWHQDPGAQTFRAMSLLAPYLPMLLSLPTWLWGGPSQAGKQPSGGVVDRRAGERGEGRGRRGAGGWGGPAPHTVLHPGWELSALTCIAFPTPFSFSHVSRKFSMSRALKKNTHSNVIYIILQLLYYITFYLSTPCSAPDTVPTVLSAVCRVGHSVVYVFLSSLRY